MAERIVFYSNPQSRAAIVRWMLEEVGAEYETRHIDFEKGDNRSPDFLKVNPMGKIPTVIVGDTVITEAPAIIAWLADAYPEAGLAPPVGSHARGTWYRWLFFGGSCVEPALVDKMFDRPDVPQPGALGYGSYERTLNTLVETLKDRPYLLGDDFSAADLYVAAELGWASAFGAPGIRDNEVLWNYVQRCTARPAYKGSVGGQPGEGQ